MSRARSRGAPAAGALALLALASCAPDAANVQGDAVRDLYRIFLYAAAAVFAIVVGLIGWSIVRYRDRPGRGLPHQHHGNVKLEVAWFALPQAVVVGLFLLSVGTLSDVSTRPSRADLSIAVEGYQWGWRFDYGDGRVVSSAPGRPAELVVPVRRTVTFRLTSADVIHSFYVPRFLVKRDTVPGKVNELHVTVQEPGTYRGVCAEFCGLLHARMDFTVRALEPEEFERWLGRSG